MKITEKTFNSTENVESFDFARELCLLQFHSCKLMSTFKQLRQISNTEFV